MSRYSRITGTGSHLPPRRVTNADLAAELATRGVETSDDWIVERTGIRARHFAAPDVTSGAAKWRARMPVRSTIHSSEGSTPRVASSVARSAWVPRRGGR